MSSTSFIANVSPESILIRTKDKVAKLGDMMLAKAMEGIKAKQITRPGELVGNIAYMAPERHRG
jgi:serine/threonine protein kinase